MWQLNHDLVQAEMKRLRWRVKDMAEATGMSPPLVQYAMRRGSIRYADMFAKILRCKPETLIQKTEVKK